ncbi:LuxR C-terminal-related transcriptional regulator [Kitasatospora sp. NPDC057015]|uniref:LuxR C-terminal-related transcriptional regulator n=1 Tax=Kitasatospora sp. NPDC057015 TaxID=3346001 RepID=UPI0036384C83
MRVGRAPHARCEQQVHDLLVHGAVNKDIAAALFLSPRTVEHHVAAILRKLGTTREQLTRPNHPPTP